MVKWSRGDNIESIKTLRQGDWEVGCKGWLPYLKDDPLPQVTFRVQTEFRIIGPIALSVLGIRVGFRTRFK